MTAPRYQEVKAADIPEVTDDDAAAPIRIVWRKFLGKKGPVDGVAADPVYLDVSVAPGRRKTLPVETTRHAFAYVFAGAEQVLQRLGALGRCRPKAESNGSISRRHPDADQTI